MARSTGIVVTLALLAGLFLLGQAAGAAVDYYQMQSSMEGGLAWLALQQNTHSPEGSEEYGSWGNPPDTCSNNHRVQTTSFAVKKMLDRARELDTTPPPEAQYGLNFIFRKVQADGSIWDYYPYETCDPETPPSVVIETSSAVMAIVSSGDPGAKVPELGSPVDGWTYLQVVQKAVDYLAWAQRTDGDANLYGDEGGWASGKDPAGTLDPLFGMQYADQLNTGYASLALLSAEKFEATIPTGVENRLLVWIGNIQAPDGISRGCVPASDACPANSLFTGFLLVEQGLAGMKPGDTPVVNAIGYLERTWIFGFSRYGHLTPLIFTTGMNSVGLATFKPDGTPIDWFDAFARDAIESQNDQDNSWPAQDDVWANGDQLLATEWALLTLEAHVYPAEIEMTAQVEPTGESHTCTVTVTNTGETALYNLGISESSTSATVFGLSAVQPVKLVGDDVIGDTDGIFEPGEIWTFTAATKVPATMTDTIAVIGEDIWGREVTATQDVSVIVAVSQAPVAIDDSYDTNEDTTLIVVASEGVLVNDGDPDGDTLTAVLVTSPGKGTVTLNTDGSFTYIPVANSNGVDSFTYKVNDGQADSNTAIVTITVNPVNDPPNVEPEPLCLWPPNHQYENVAIDVTDLDNDPLIITIKSVTVDEPTALVTGAGGKNKAPDADAIIGEDLVRLLRSERSGNGNGRAYVITFTADDGTAPEATGYLNVCVPHDLNAGCTCVDDGQIYDATKYN